MRIPVHHLQDLYDGLARAHGAGDEEARLFAESLLEADLRAHQTQGIALVPYMDELFEARHARFGAAFEVIRESSASALIDGHGGSGHVAAAKAMDLAIEKARICGVGLVTVRNSGDCGMVASYSLRAVEQGMIGLSMSTGPLLVAPWGGRDVKFCTNPFSIAVPAGEEDPIVVDMATSASSMGKVVLAARDGQRLEGAWLVDPEGNYTDDPARVILNAMDRESPLNGALLPAGARGFGMLLMVEMLAALLSGERDWQEDGAGEVATAVNTLDRPAYYAQTLIAISVEHFQDPAAFAASAERMVRVLTAMTPAKGFASVRLPGGGAGKRRSAWLRDGVELRAEEWDMAMAVAEKRGFADKLRDIA